MGSRRVLVLALVAVALAAVVAWRRGWMATVPAPAPATAPARPTPPPFQSAWATEQEWLVDRITRDIAEMAAFAGTGAPPAAAAAPPKPEAIPPAEHLFSPSAYEPFARQALASSPAGVAPAVEESSHDARLLSALLDLRTAVLLGESAALSRQLEASPRDAGAHERSALLLGAFALRDAAGRSTDTRPALTRMTAHLAFAQALRGNGEPGASGRLAEAILLTLVGREQDALARLDALGAAGASPAQRAWVRALRLRNTGDWRIARDEASLTRLERLEEFRALVAGLRDSSALAWLDEGRPDLAPDWGLVAMDEYLSVEVANRFADATPALVLQEAAEALADLRGPPADEAAFLAALGERPGRLVERDDAGKPRLRVLGWGLWADRAQRHLVFGLVSGASSRRALQGQPGEAEAFFERARASFGRLELFPVVLRYCAWDAKAYPVAMATVRELALRSPERLTGGHWALFRVKETFAPVPSDLPDENTWFRPALPPGTLLDVAWRLEALAELRGLSPAALAALRGLAPHNVALARLAGERLPAGRSAADLAAVYGPLAEFNVDVMAPLADAAWYDPAGFRERQGALCELVPDRCFVLGYRLAEMGFADEAAVAYQKGFDRAGDRVLAANSSRWLVDYYFDHAETKKAEAVARAAAEVYSSAGLFVRARLAERMGRLPEAEEYYRRILDRYDQPEELTGFYYRMARVEKKAAYEPKLRDALARALPSGLEPLDRSALPAPPADGVVVRGANDNTKRFGMAFGNVIVGVDGFRVRDLRSHRVAVALDKSPRMVLVVWRGKSYDDVEVDLWDRQLRVELADLAAKP
jgi:hypothetical protein